MTIIKALDSRYWDGVLPPSYEDFFSAYFQKVSAGRKWVPGDLKKLQKNWKRVKDIYKLPRGPYHFTVSPYKWEDPIANGKSQGDNFWFTLRDKYEGEFGELPPIVDIEHRFSGMMTGEKLISCIRALLDKVHERFDRVPMIYTAGWYWDQFIAPHTGTWKYWEEHELWEADPPPDTSIKGWVDGGDVVQVVLDKSVPGFNAVIDISETTQAWLDKHTKPIEPPPPPPGCDKERTAMSKALGYMDKAMDVLENGLGMV